MVIVRIGAGLGNQLFQYAFARNIAIKLKTKLKIDLTQCEKDKSTPFAFFRLDAFNLKDKTFATQKEIDSIDHTWKIFNDQSQPEVHKGDNVFFEGGSFEQKEIWFAENAKEIVKEFTLKEPLHEISAQWKKKIKSSKNPVALHIRIGDCLNPFWRNQGVNNFPKQYYLDCLEILKKDYPEMTIFVFSDGIQWAKENFKLDYPTYYVEGCERDYEEQYLMSCCDHNIVAHSTFSFWGAYLNPNPKKKVFCKPQAQGWREACQSWIQVPIDFSQKPMLELTPSISFIFYVEDNNSQALEFSLMSILQQRCMRDYEIIIVNTSRDETGDVCRKFATIDCVTVLNVDKSLDKYSAFNMALKIARGLFVTFCTAKTFLIPEALMSLFYVWNNEYMKRYFNKYSEIKEHFYYANYERAMNMFTSDIYYSVRTVNEDENGSIDWNDKKFEPACENAFINLNEYSDSPLDDVQRVGLVFNNESEDLLLGKFFKRKFLNDYDIRFKQREIDETAETAGGVLFLIESMLLSKTTAFIPQMLFGRLK